MGKACPHCGETSDRDDLCTWCNKSLRPEAKPAAPPAAPAPARPAPAGPAPSAREPVAAAPPRPLWPYFVGAGVTLVLVLLLTGFLAGKQAAGPPPEPGNWSTQQSKTKLLTLHVPDNYVFSTSGSSASYEQVYIRATKLCRVTVDGNGTKGAMSDAIAATSRAGGGDSSGTVASSAEGKFHALQGGLLKTKDPAYQEEGEVSGWSFAGMPAAYSDYTSFRKVGLVAVKVRGWRLSCMGGDFGYQVFAEAPEAQWEKFQPTARRILESAKLGAQN